MTWRSNDQMRERLDTLESEIEELEAERDRLEASIDAHEDADIEWHRSAEWYEANRRLAAMNGELQWLRAEFDEIDDVLPFERPDYSWAR